MEDVQIREKLASIEKAWVITSEKKEQEKLITIINAGRTPLQIAEFISQYWVISISKDYTQTKINHANMKDSDFKLKTQMIFDKDNHVRCGYENNYITASICNDINLYDNDDFEYTNRFGNKYINFKMQEFVQTNKN